MSERVKKAIENHKNGYNCAQAVICAYCDLLGMDEKSAFVLSEGFGGGMGGLQETCGAVSAMFMLAGIQNSTGNLQSPDSKGATYKIVRELAAKFKEKNSSIICKELKGLTGKPMLRSCDGCIEDACRIFESLISSTNTPTQKLSKPMGSTP